MKHKQRESYIQTSKQESEECKILLCTIPYSFKWLNNRYGDGKGTHVSVFTKLLAGRYANQLHWPCLGTVTYELLNQLEDNHHSMEITRDASHDLRVCGSYGYCASLFSLGHNPATNTQYVLDDALYFRVSVKVDNHKHSWSACGIKQ